MVNDVSGNSTVIQPAPNRAPVRLKLTTDEDGRRCYIDTTTRNISFLQCASDLAKLGIKNNDFMLVIYNRDLIGVDPYDPALSKGMIKAIILECMMNPYYFLREVVRIPEEGGAVGIGGGCPFILHRGNLALVFCFLHNIDVYLLLPRQCFKTMSTLCILLWAYLFGITNAQFNFINKRQPDADDNLKKFNALKDALPVFIQQKYKFVEDTITGDMKIDKGINNVRRIKNPVTNNRIESKPSAISEESADGIGRGNTAPIQWSDETEFTKFMGTIIAASGPAYVRAAETAERLGTYHCRIFTTTPKIFLGGSMVTCERESC
jgi:hypothetical protein